MSVIKVQIKIVMDFLFSEDCDDLDPASNTVFVDADCDGALTADDCDDSDPNLYLVTDDGDCDGVLTAVDCDDS